LTKTTLRFDTAAINGSLSFTAVSSDDALADYEETVHLTIFTPFISFLVVLISFLALLSLIAFFTETGSMNT